MFDPDNYYTSQEVDEKYFVNSAQTKSQIESYGYITGYTGDYCYRDNIKLNNNLTLNEVYDHQFLICDPNNDHYNIYTLRCLLSGSP